MADHARKEGRWGWRSVDWLALLGSSAALIIGGRVAIAIKTVVDLWMHVGGREIVNQQIDRELERATTVGELPQAAHVAGTLSISEEDTTAIDFALSLVQAWYLSEEESLEDFVKQAASRVWADATARRRVLQEAVWDPEEIRILCREAGLDMARISFQSTAEKQWFSVFEYLRNQRPAMLLYLLYLAARRAPAEAQLQVWKLD